MQAKDILQGTHTCLDLTCKFALVESIEAIMMQEFSIATPKHDDHIIDDHKVNAALARRHLFGWPS